MSRARTSVIALAAGSVLAAVLAGAAVPSAAEPRPIRAASDAAALLAAAGGATGADAPLVAGAKGPGAYDVPTPRTRLTRMLAPSAPLGDFGCVGYGSLLKDNPPAQVMNDYYTAQGFKPYRVAQAGDVDWTLDPYTHPTWRLWFHSLRWLGGLIEEFRLTGTVAYADRARTIAQDWLRDNPMDTLSTISATATAHRTSALLCLREVLGNEPWLVDALDAHATWLTAHYAGMWNQGLDDNLMLFGVGCELGRRDYADFAVQRLTDLVPVAIDAQGASNEQSLGYAGYAYRRFRLMVAKLGSCNYPVPTVLAQRLPLMPAMFAHATQPDGTVAQIGDTERARTGFMPGTAAEYASSLGTSGAPLPARVAVYRAGYVFGRSAWTPFGTASHYTLRFGPGRALHGHHDRASVLYYARGKELLGEAGFVGYEDSPRRTYDRSFDGHNVLLVNGATYRSQPVTLTRSIASAAADTYTLRDTSWVGRVHVRSVLVLRKPDAVVVLDHVVGGDARQYNQIWHLAPHLVAGTPSRSAVRAVPAVAGNGPDVVLAQVALPGQVLPAGSTAVTTGAVAPLQGWTSPRLYQWWKAPTVTMRRAGLGTRQLTVIAPVSRSGGVRASAVAAANGDVRISLVVDGVAANVMLRSDDALGRIT